MDISFLINRKNKLLEALDNLSDDMQELIEKQDKKHEIQHQIAAIDDKITFMSHTQEVGNCYTQNSVGYGYNGIMTFKILKVLEPPNHNDALCLCISANDDRTAFANYSKSIRKIVVPLWGLVKLRSVRQEFDKKVIEQYHKIGDTEFWQLFDQMLQELQE